MPNIYSCTKSNTVKLIFDLHFPNVGSECLTKNTRLNIVLCILKKEKKHSKLHGIRINIFITKSYFAWANSFYDFFCIHFIKNRKNQLHFKLKGSVKFRRADSTHTVRNYYNSRYVMNFHTYIPTYKLIMAFGLLNPCSVYKLYAYHK